MKTRIPHLLVPLLALWPALQAPAAVNPTIIPAEARWVVHADLNALRDSTLGREFVAKAEQAQAQAPIGIDFGKVMATVGTMTAYGTNFTADPKALDGALILQGTDDLRKITESMLLQATIASPETAAELKDFPFPAYSLSSKQKAGGQEQVGLIVAFPPEPVVLVSKSRAQLLRARDAFRGAVASVARSPKAPLRQLLASSDEAYLMAASVVPTEIDIPENQPQARILKMTESAAIAIGERGPNTFAHAKLVASSNDMADKLMKIVQGMTALLSLTETNDKQLAEFLSSAKVERQDRTVTLDLSYASERLLQMIQMVSAHKEAPRKEQASAERAAQLVSGEPIAQWSAERAPEGTADQPPKLATRTIERVELKNSTIITLGRHSNGGKPVRFDHVEITPAGGGTPLVYRLQMLRTGGPNGRHSTLAFPGVDGTYNIKVVYVNDPQGKALYAVSIRHPKPPEENSEAAPGHQH